METSIVEAPASAPPAEVVPTVEEIEAAIRNLDAEGRQAEGWLKQWRAARQTAAARNAPLDLNAEKQIPLLEARQAALAADRTRLLALRDQAEEPAIAAWRARSEELRTRVEADWKGQDDALVAIAAKVSELGDLLATLQARPAEISPARHALRSRWRPASLGADGSPTSPGRRAQASGLT